MSYLKSVRQDRSNRRVNQALADYDRQHIFHVYDGDDNERGAYPTLTEARGCVEFDALPAYSIVYGDWNLIEQVSA